MRTDAPAKIPEPVGSKPGNNLRVIGLTATATIPELMGVISRRQYWGEGD